MLTIRAAIAHPAPGPSEALRPLPVVTADPDDPDVVDGGVDSPSLPAIRPRTGCTALICAGDAPRPGSATGRGSMARAVRSVRYQPFEDLG